jgi:rRNA maturation endonuclease Nob1
MNNKTWEQLAEIMNSDDLQRLRDLTREGLTEMESMIVKMPPIEEHVEWVECQRCFGTTPAKNKRCDYCGSAQ